MSRDGLHFAPCGRPLATPLGRPSRGAGGRAMRRGRWPQSIPRSLIMQANPSVAIVIAEVLRHTPSWVWGVLAVITLLGAWQLRDLRVSRSRLMLLPIALGA